MTGCKSPNPATLLRSSEILLGRKRERGRRRLAKGRASTKSSSEVLSGGVRYEAQVPEDPAASRLRDSRRCRSRESEKEAREDPWKPFRNTGSVHSDGEGPARSPARGASFGPESPRREDAALGVGRNQGTAPLSLGSSPPEPAAPTRGQPTSRPAPGPPGGPSGSLTGEPAPRAPLAQPHLTPTGQGSPSLPSRPPAPLTAPPSGRERALGVPFAPLPATSRSANRALLRARASPPAAL